MGEPAIGIIIGSKSDWHLVEKALEAVAELNLRCAARIASAHRTPEAVMRWIKEAEEAGVQVFVAVAGMAAALPGVVSAQTLLPVIGVPVEADALRGQDALYSIVQMPPGIPVAAVGINSVQNALLLAAEIIALHDCELRKRLVAFRKNRMDKIETDQQELMSRFPHLALNPAPAKVQEKPKAAPVAPQPKPAPASIISKRPNIPAASPAPKSRQILRVDPDNPSFEAIERVADAILEGKIVAIPTDTVYGLACDSTNEKAVHKLYDIKGRKESKPIPLLIDSMKTLSRLVRKIPKDVEEMLDELWPGALTVIFSKPETMLSAVSNGDTIGIRIPDCTVALGVINMAARPLAVTSANPSGQPPARTAEQVKEYFGGKVDIILDAGEMRCELVSTVLSVIKEPYTILREGALSFDSLRYHIKNIRKG
ncbi:MAG: N5-carboxyaminoimidazole ribonucleotide mutase [candidate division BRC1 bacterium ADurb.Bin183]|nr:MAG: N5-carboxyaminoimidazole ribonucleotide mutase [candidate division BRC1 bacterium ADurb.Bin183]